MKSYCFTDLSYFRIHSVIKDCFETIQFEETFVLYAYGFAVLIFFALIINMNFRGFSSTNIHKNLSIYACIALSFLIMIIMTENNILCKKQQLEAVHRQIEHEFNESNQTIMSYNVPIDQIKELIEIGCFMKIKLRDSIYKKNQ